MTASSIHKELTQRIVALEKEIAQLRQADEELQQYKHIIENTRNPIALVDRNFKYLYVNEATAEALGKPLVEIIGRSVPDLFERAFFETVMAVHYQRCFDGEQVTYQSWFEFPGWGKRYMDIRYYPFRTADGQITSVVVNAHDITDIKQLEIELRESEERFRAFMDNNPASIYIKDENDRHIYGNPEALKSVGKKPDEFIGSSTRDLWPPEVAELLVELDQKVLREEVARIAEEWQNTKEGDIRWRKDIKFPISLESGKKLLGGIAIDITEIKQKEQELRNAYEEIEQLKQKLEQENIYLREELQISQAHDRIVGESDVIRQTLRQAEQVADKETTVLILGETGTGKELLAHAIHESSARKDHALVKVNCAALPANLVESELFGREKGAFTGAMARQAGRFEAADKGTIFLDEVGDLPLDLQTKLLRVLQDGEFERLGSSKTISVDVRVIAATNRDLQSAIQEGRFRRDLYYRLNVFPITVPPLRERFEDIPLLTWAFVKQYNKSMGKQISKIKQRSMDSLKAYSWPGNVRELKNIIERSMILSSGTDLDLADIEPDISAGPANLNLMEVETSHILKVLKTTHWRIRGESGAAEILGLKPTTLEARMKKLGIHRKKR